MGEQGGVFIQFGAGAGDRDSRAGFKDGFSSYIKNLPKERVKKLFLIEPNPVNIPFLKECWATYEQSQILEVALVPSNLKMTELDFYFCPSDGPHFQVASVKKEHVQKHYGDTCEIGIHKVKTIDINTFLQEVGEDIEMLALDIEGLESEIIHELDFSKYKIKYISFEHIHLGHNKESVEAILQKNNYVYVGSGMDKDGLDSLYKLKNPHDFS